MCFELYKRSLSSQRRSSGSVELGRRLSWAPYLTQVSSLPKEFLISLCFLVGTVSKPLNSLSFRWGFWVFFRLLKGPGKKKQLFFSPFIFSVLNLKSSIIMKKPQCTWISLGTPQPCLSLKVLCKARLLDELRVIWDRAFKKGNNRVSSRWEKQLLIGLGHQRYLCCPSVHWQLRGLRTKRRLAFWCQHDAYSKTAVGKCHEMLPI